MSVGCRIKERRKELNMSAEQLADMIGVSPATIYRYENGHIANMGTDKLEVIAHALSTEPKYLMGWSESESRSHPYKAVPPYSEAALELARVFDTLDPHGQQVLQTVARLESERKPQPLPKGLKPLGEIPVYKVPLIGTASCDGSVEMKQAAKLERAELEREETVRVEK